MSLFDQRDSFPFRRGGRGGGGAEKTFPMERGGKGGEGFIIDRLYLYPKKKREKKKKKVRLLLLLRTLS